MDIKENANFDQSSASTLLPSVSIITVVFNADQVLEKTILSVLGQKYENLEYIIIDGGSTDGTHDIIQKYKDEIDYWICEKDEGIYDAMNKGISAATGQWIHFLNAGDLYVSEQSLQHMLKPILTNPDINLLYTKNLKGFGSLSQNFSYFFFFRQMICHQSIIYSRNLFQTHKFNTLLKYCGDFAHLLKTFDAINPFRLDGDGFVIYDLTGISSIKTDIYKIWQERAISVMESNTPLWWKLPMYLYACTAAYWRKRYIP